MKVTKAVITVAGLGTRLMPLTLHQPKAMVAIVDRPIIHYLIDELAGAGIKNFLIVHSAGQESVRQYTEYLQNDPEWQKLGLSFDFAEQKELKGSADALLAAESFADGDPFLVYYGDDLLDDETLPAKVFVRYYEQVQAPILILQEIPKELSIKYAMVTPVEISKDFYKILAVVEKPRPEDAKSNLGGMGRFLLTPAIFPSIRKAHKVFSGKKEIAVADALQVYLEDGGLAYGWVYRGRHFDCGSKLGLMQARLYHGLKHPAMKDELKKFIAGEISSTPPRYLSENPR